MYDCEIIQLSFWNKKVNSQQNIIYCAKQIQKHAD